MNNDLQTWQIVLCWVLAMAALVPALMSNRAGMARVAALPVGPARNRFFRFSLVMSALQFGGVGLVIVQQLGGLSSLWHLPAAFGPVHAALDVDVGPFLPLWMGLFAIGLIIITEIVRKRHKPSRPAPQSQPRISPLRPRTYVERWWGAAVSVTVGVAEEIFFRLALPLVLLTVIPSVWWALGLSAVIFGLAHGFQSWIAVVAITIMGAVLTLFYLFIGHLWVAMAAHVVWDLVVLVLIPWRMAQTNQITDQTGS